MNRYMVLVNICEEVLTSNLEVTVIDCYDNFFNRYVYKSVEKTGTSFILRTALSGDGEVWNWYSKEYTSCIEAVNTAMGGIL